MVWVKGRRRCGWWCGYWAEDGMGDTVAGVDGVDGMYVFG